MKHPKNVLVFVLIFIMLFQSNVAYGKVREVDLDKYEFLEQKLTPLDISSVVNMAFEDEVAGDGKGGWTDQGPTNDFSNFEIRGVNKFLGVDFNIIDPIKNNNKSCIVLRGQNDILFPISVDIKVGAKGAGIYFLHCGSWLSARVGKYVFVYEDGSEVPIEIVGKRDMGDWWGTTETDTVRTAWKGSNQAAGVISVGLFAMENPHPEKKIDHLRIDSYGDATYPIIIAATLTSAGPYLPKVEAKTNYNPDTSTWYPFEYSKDNTLAVNTAIDASFLLDAPAGKHGFAKADEDKIIFEDGTEEKFWGANIGAEMCYPDYRDGEYLALSFAQRGFNLVRFHMMDYIYSERNIFGYNDINRDTSQIDKELLDRFFYLVYQFKQRGIYTWVDLCVARQAKENDNVQDVSTLANGFKYALFYDEHLQELQMKFTEVLMGTVNPYTGVKLCEDPTVLCVAFNNESSITHDNFASKYYNREITQKYNDWLKKQYKTREELRQAWYYDGADILEVSEDQFHGTVKIYGMDKRSGIRGKRKIDNIRFLSETQSQYFEKMMAHYKGIGGKQMMTGTTAFWNDMTSIMKSLTVTDFIDAHKYFSHPSGLNNFNPGAGISNAAVSMLEDAAFGIFSYLSTMDLYGKPNTISEWNSCEFNPYISEAPLMMAAYSGLHNWMPMIFSSSGRLFTKSFNDSRDPLKLNSFFAVNDSPQVDSVLPAAAIAFRSVAEAEKGFYNRYKGNEVYEGSRQVLSCDPYMFAIGKTGFSIDETAYDPNCNSNDILYLLKKAKNNKTPFVSITDEMSLDAQNKIFKLNTDKSQGVTGFFANKSIELDDVIINTRTEYATIVLSSITKNPIWNSDRLLLTTAARARNTGFVLNKDGTKVVDGGTAPVLAEPVEGEFVLKTYDDVKVYSLQSNGLHKGEVRAEKTKEGYTKFKVGIEDKAFNYEIVKKENVKNRRKQNKKISLGDLTVSPVFEDVQDDNQSASKIERMVLQNYISGISDKLFAPDKPITRGDFVSMLIKSLKLSKSGGVNFDDVTVDMTAYPQILSAKGLGIAKGGDNNLFRPNDPLTRQDMFTMLAAALKCCPSSNIYENMGDLSCFKDNSQISHYAKDAVSALLGMGYVYGEEIRPLSYVTRSESTALIYDVLWK